jgi:hypothetical protein
VRDDILGLLMMMESKRKEPYEMTADMVMSGTKIHGDGKEQAGHGESPRPPTEGRMLGTKPTTQRRKKPQPQNL